MSDKKKLKFYFSFRSPFAGIAFYRLRRSPLFKDYEIELIPVWPDLIFGGHMDNPTDNLFKMAYIFSDAARQADEAGLPSGYFRRLASHFVLPKDVDYKKEKAGLNLPFEPWEIPHHAFLYAAEQGKGWAFGDAVFSRRFSFEGQAAENVLDKAVIAHIAESLDLNPDATANAHESGLYEEQQTRIVSSSEADGVFGVPFFVIPGQDQDQEQEVFWGNDRLSFVYKSLSGESALPTIEAASLSHIQATRQ